MLCRPPRPHRIPYGPLRGDYLFTSFAISPRMYFGVGEPWVSTLAAQYLSEGDVVYDIGAHIGYTTLGFSRRVGPIGRVFAFELLPSTSRMLSKTVALNARPNITVYNVGLSNCTGTVDLAAGETMMASLTTHATEDARGGERCPVVRLDDFRLTQGIPPPRFIKIDVEGAEFECLQGAERTLLTFRPVLVVEIHSGELLARCAEYLADFGYRLLLKSGRLIDVRAIDPRTSFYQSVLCLHGAC